MRVFYGRTRQPGPSGPDPRPRRPSGPYRLPSPHHATGAAIRVPTLLAAIAVSTVLAAGIEDGEGAGEGEDAAEHSVGGEDEDEDEDNRDDRAIPVLFPASGPVRPRLEGYLKPRVARTA